MQDTHALRLQPYHPTTFLERGVAVPFTTPMLAGTRARPMERGGTELIVPNPSGGSGAYVLPWDGVGSLCRPTMHDRRLNEAIARLKTLTPAAIRQAARDIAAEGLAGRSACKTATQARANEHQDRLLTNFLLLLALVKQGESAGTNPVPPEQEQPAMLERRAKRVIAQVAPRLGMTPDTIATSLEQLAGLFAPIGLGKQVAEARHSRAMDALSRLRDEALAWSQAHDDDSADQARLICEAASFTLLCAMQTIADLRALTDDLLQLVRAWNSRPDSIAQRLTRPDWLLDGWEPICLVWTLAENDDARRDALAEMALMAPVMPKEIMTWMDETTIAREAGRFHRSVRINQDWRTGITVFDLIARNERIRALAA